MEAGSYQFEDYVYEQRRRNGEFDANPPAAGGRKGGSGDAANRLLTLLAQDKGGTPPASVASTPEKKRESSTALLGSVAEESRLAEAAAAPGESNNETEAGQSSTYKKALAKLQTYEAPTPPPLRAVSGFQGLMTAKPSEQTVEPERSGTLSALKLE